MKYFLYAFSLAFLACQNGSDEDSNPAKNATNKLRYVHYNIKELDSQKLRDETEQALSAAQILSELAPDFVSINEIQYDMKDVPTIAFKSEGKNLDKLLRLSGIGEDWDQNFYPANTGARAQKDENGDFSANRGNMGLVDSVNFGFFPGQYSTGFASRFSIESKLNINMLTWKDWDPSVDLSEYDIGGVSETTYELFDKSFNVSKVKIGGHLVQFVTFHTVPAYRFGNSKSPNIERNKAQLEFLSWYLIGECDSRSESIVKSCRTKIRPLSKGERFIVAGDLNVDLSSENPGAFVLKSLLADSRVHDRVSLIADGNLLLEEQFPAEGTYFRSGIDYSNQVMQLDYFIVSSNIKIDRLETHLPVAQLEKPACFEDYSEAFELVSSRSLEKNGNEYEVFERYNPKEHCVLGASPEYMRLRKASDHLPLILEFSL